MPESERQRRDRELIAIAGLALLVVSITSVVFVITDFLFHRGWAATFTALIALTFIVLWYGLPLRAAYRDRRRAS